MISLVLLIFIFLICVCFSTAAKVTLDLYYPASHIDQQYVSLYGEGIFGVDIETCLFSMTVTDECPGGLSVFNTSMKIQQTADYLGNNRKCFFWVF